jgi:hypothetical protein
MYHFDNKNKNQTQNHILALGSGSGSCQKNCSIFLYRYVVTKGMAYEAGQKRNKNKKEGRWLKFLMGKN